MVDVGVLPGFIAVILLFLIPPGPDMAYMLAVGLESGRRSALKAILGIGTGMSVYAAAVVIGVGKVAQSYPLLLDAVKIFGAAYLLWLAFVTIRNARRMTSGSSGVSAGRPYLRGVLVSLTNPKVILFFLAVLPQFMGDAESAGLQLVMLGTVNVLAEVLLYGTIGLLAGVFHSRFNRSQQAGALLNYLAGGVPVTGGLRPGRSDGGLEFLLMVASMQEGQFHQALPQPDIVIGIVTSFFTRTFKRAPTSNS